MSTKANAAPVIEDAAKFLIPLNKLTKYPKNARKTPHSECSNVTRQSAKV